MKNVVGNTSDNRPSNHICMGILAHVDAGKTTLAEGILYITGKIRKLGRVDHKDAFLDTHEIERARGITIFSKQAEVQLGEKQVTLLDTPGHADFSAEMERTLQVLDYAILVISGADGVQGHVETLWRLLERYHIPTFLFVNKMDQEGTDAEQLLEELKKRLSGDCEDFTGEEIGLELSQNFQERIALHEEEVLERYLEGKEPNLSDIRRLIRERKLFPCFFGSALKLTGVPEFLQALELCMEYPWYPKDFGVKVYKIARDAAGNRLTHLKVTGGSLKVKMTLSNIGKSNGGNEKEEDIWEEKVDQIRVYSGNGYEAVGEVQAGCVCAVTGLKHTYSGQGLGVEAASELPLLEPVLTYRVKPQVDYDMHVLYLKLRQLEEEIPELHIIWKEEVKEIHAQIMGEVQIDVLKVMIEERFGVAVAFDEGNIVYKETIAEAVEGVGHFEPLRHYAEVHLLLEPGERGSGLEFDTSCSEDMLDRNWQRLVLTHLEEKAHRGVLTGSEITDMKITLIAGRAHQKHTEGGDFRQATYRAVRQGLMKAESILLEPVYEFRMEVPQEMIGRAMADVQRMNGTFEPPVADGEVSVLTGSAPVICMRGYQTELIAYTRGRGRLSCSLKGYEKCHNQAEVLEQTTYVAEADTENPADSVFCAHGAGFVVNWNQVEDYMHVEGLSGEKEKSEDDWENWSEIAKRKHDIQNAMADAQELEEIFARTYGSIRQKRAGWKRTTRAEAPVTVRSLRQKSGEEYLLVDGYNIIFAWEDLKELAKENIEAARNKLMDILCDYQGYRKMTLILVFDAYKVPGNTGEVQTYHNIHVVYTKEAETADQYIEKTVHRIGGKHQVSVATSDALEQVIILGQGAERISAGGLLAEIRRTKEEMRQLHLHKEQDTKQYLFETMPEEMAALMEEVRMGRRQLNGSENSEEK